MTGGDLPCIKAGEQSMEAQKEFQRRDARRVHDPREADSSSLGSPSLLTRSHVLTQPLRS